MFGVLLGAGLRWCEKQAAIGSRASTALDVLGMELYCYLGMDDDGFEFVQLCYICEC